MLESETNYKYNFCLFTVGEKCYLGDKTTYMGKVSTTENDKTCQAWASRSPHDHTGISDQPLDFPDRKLPSNLCRSPLDHPRDRPWCYTTDPDINWEYCDIRECSKFLFLLDCLQ